MAIDIMLDLETWGTDPGRDLRSIGACVFDPGAGTVSDIDQFYIATDNPKGYHGNGVHKHRFFPDEKGWARKYSLTRDPRTVQWWSEQSDEAQAAFAGPVDLREALGRFDSWLGGLFNYEVILAETDCIRLWSHGAATDGPWLAAAYKAVGLPVPWHYRAPRDTRTCFDMAGIEDHTAWLKQHPGPLGIPHHALDDAICQARAVCAAMEMRVSE